MQAYEDAIAVPDPVGAVQKAKVRRGLAPSDGKPRMGAHRLPSLETIPARHSGLVRRGLVAGAGRRPRRSAACSRSSTSGWAGSATRS